MTDCEKIIESGVFSQITKVENAAYAVTEGIVGRWAEEAKKAQTHRAVCRFLGEWKNKGGKVFTWNDKL